MNRKKDALLIEDFLNNLSKSCQLPSSLKWWPKYLFRLENITSAAAILDNNLLYSRKRAEDKSIDCSMSACKSILGHTPDKWQSYVRLYFRPRTPFQYVTEGIRAPSDFIYEDAHCPIPVLLLFGSIDLLTRETTHFSNGCLARREAVVGHDFTFLKAIPFDKVYHDSSWGDQGDIIKFHRHAEVMIPDELDLSSLKYIIARCQSEKETLLNILSPDTRIMWRDKIMVKPSLFFCNFNYVQNTNLSNDNICIDFKCGGHSVFGVDVEVEHCGNGNKYPIRKIDFPLSNGLKINVAPLGGVSYMVTVKLNNLLAYKGKYFADVPF